MIFSGNAYSYVRFSSERQLEGDSLRRQLKRAEDFANKHNLTLDSHSYSDLGVSAFKGKNAIEEKLGTFLKAVDDGIIKKGSILLIESLDRLSRAQVHEALMLFLSIMKRGVTIVTLMDEQVYSTERFVQDNGMSLIISLTYLMRAHEESATKSLRIKSALANKRAEWVPGKIMSTSSGPGWLKLNESKTAWVPIPEKAAVLQRIYSMAETMGGVKIVNALNEESVPTMHYAKYWTQGVVGALLRNPAAMGTLIQATEGNRVIEDYYPAVISKQQWMYVQDAVRGRATTGGTKSEKVSNLFSGISFCHQCGGRTRFVPTFKNSAYVHCLASYSNHGTCDARPFPYNAAEAVVLHRLMHGQLRRLDNEYEKDDEGQRLVLGEEIEQLKKRQAAAISMMLSMPDVTPLQTELRKLQDQIESLTTEMKSLDLSRMTLEEERDALERFYRHRELSQEDPTPELIELRKEMLASIRRILRKVAFDSKNNIVQLTFASGNVRDLDATPYVHERTLKAQVKREK
jgi:DNA invertase Pin-like site-specific DNA recombinase